MTWNYRILKYKNGGLGIHEVYYDKNGKPEMCTQDAIIVCNIDEGVESLFNQLKMIRHDIKKSKDDILEFDRF